MVGNLADESSSIVGSSPDPQLVAEQEELRTAVLEAVNTLSPKNRSAIVLFYQKQYSLQEVANCLNISVSAVKGRLHKSRHQIREQLSLHQIQPNLQQEIKTMTDTSSTQPAPEFICSFCGKGKDDVEMLIAGPLLKTVKICICNECVDICNKLISGEMPRLTPEEAEKLRNSAN